MHLATRFAVGDVTGPFQFPHVSAHRAWCGAVNGLFGDFKRFKADEYAVGEWKRAHPTASVLRWLAGFHRWRLGGYVSQAELTSLRDRRPS
ncbi:hypothetical protein [Pseudomonas sp. Q2-TVG4-2]|uniref:hypothetical protein n=1 Tax=Pseudomonas sp. Q2-TVG4-2 TaxID=1685699 RepID=UPI0035C71279